MAKQQRLWVGQPKLAIKGTADDLRFRARKSWPPQDLTFNKESILSNFSPILSKTLYTSLMYNVLYLQRKLLDLYGYKKTEDSYLK